MSETWIDLLNSMGVFAEHQAEKCHWCRKDEGTVQMWGQNRHGEKFPLYKVCTSCHAEFKRPSAWMQKWMAKRK